MKFFRQYSTGPYILDFYCAKLKLAIELDGGQHTHEDNLEYDAERSAYLKSQGIDVIRFWNHEVLQDTDSVLAMIAQKITPPSPLTIRGVTEEERKMKEFIKGTGYISQKEKNISAS
jgi:adenine-specific DNA-methyltransferase